MTVLSAAQSAGIRLVGTKPASLFSSTDSFSMELADLVNEVASDIVQSHDWRVLTKLATLVGDGVETSFSLPADYDRMPKKARLHSKTWLGADYRAARDLDEWLYLNDTAFSATPGNWVVLGGFMQIYPAIPTGDNARFYYISKNFATGGTKAAFTADTDTFVLSERLLTLGLIWRWRSQKRLEYAEDMSNFEKALSEEITKDKGSQILVAGRQRIRADVQVAYPGGLGA